MLLAVSRQVGVLGLALTHQTIGILVAASLPRAVRIGKAHGPVCVSGELLVPRHFFALIVGQRFAHGLGMDNTLTALAVLRIRQFDQHKKRLMRPTSVPTALALASPLMRSPFQCPGNYRSSTSGGRAYIDAQHVWVLPNAHYTEKNGLWVQFTGKTATTAAFAVTCNLNPPNDDHLRDIIFIYANGPHCPLLENLT